MKCYHYTKPIDKQFGDLLRSAPESLLTCRGIGKSVVVDLRGIEPRLSACKAEVLPLDYKPMADVAWFEHARPLTTLAI